MEVVVVLRDVCQDTEAIRDLKSHHVFCIQQRWNSQLLFRNPERLQTTLLLLNRTEEAARGGILKADSLTHLYLLLFIFKCMYESVKTFYDVSYVIQK